MKKERLHQLTAPLMAWYDVHKRTLPWRGTKDPYRVWLSEIMLQQTRVGAVMGYYERFLAACPTVFDLAALDTDALYKLWEGLGYYSRARNLKRAAQVIANEYGGEFPASFEELKKLPGIGDYTAAAIASIAFGEVQPAVDGNLLRVSARVAGIRKPVTDASVKKEIRQALCEAMDGERPGEYNQAMMDLGATVCLPNGAPLCEKCPARAFCEAYREDLTQILPLRGEKKKRRGEEKTVFLILREGKIALHKRAEKGLLASLWEFPNVEGNLDEASAELALAQLGFRAKTIEPLSSAKHIFTHVEWQMKGYLCAVEGENEDFVFADTALFEECAIPSAFRAFVPRAREVLGGKQ
ncbi:MAG: A/G-specific adenine glycosylase [Oscillospiraceae bacterium]|nr:A/G-specific adenine glycosylase [Oscillospiraceae bacterium]